MFCLLNYVLGVLLYFLSFYHYFVNLFQICRCGNECEVPPCVKHAGKYIFVEIDRSIDSPTLTSEIHGEGKYVNFCNSVY